MQINTNAFIELAPEINTIWSAPILVIIATVMLWSYLGVATLVGLGGMLLVSPINIFFIRRLRNLQLEKLRYQDARIKLTNEVLNGIKVKFLIKALY